MSSFLERRVDKHDDEIDLLKVADVVHDARLNEIDAWRRRDEPRIARLDEDAKVASEVRKVLDEQRRTLERRNRARVVERWTATQRAGAALVGAVGILAGIGAANQGVHILLHLIP